MAPQMDVIVVSMDLLKLNWSITDIWKHNTVAFMLLLLVNYLLLSNHFCLVYGTDFQINVNKYSL